MEEVLNQFASLILECRILSDRHDNQLSEYKARLVLIDYSVLEFTEILVHGIQKRKYSFQWMTAGFELILRWDNAAHHRHIPTFPHHKHVGDEAQIEPSQEMFLADVLRVIGEHLVKP